MSELKDLFNGIAVVIDDEIENRDANISNLIQQLNEQGTPIVRYDEIPPELSIEHMKDVSFVILDWKLWPTSNSSLNTETELQLSGPLTSSILENEGIDNNIKFIKKITDTCFCPIFIFTNDAPESISTILKDKGCLTEGSSSNIFIKQKAAVTTPKSLLECISKWLEQTPSFYVLKEWEKEYQHARTELFADFQKIDPEWPRIMWKTYKEDSVNQSLELRDLISKNLYSRMSSCTFNDKILNKETNSFSKSLVQVLEGERYLKFDTTTDVTSTNISPGELFLDYEGNYFLNIRPTCDLIPRNGANADDIVLYLIKGQQLSDNDMEKSFMKKYGAFSEAVCNAIVFPIDNGKAIKFDFKDFLISKWEDMGQMQIGRLLPPHITRVQQRFALYLQRQGLPRIPREAIPIPSNQSSATE